eukprot:GSChrysophyteH2.ASY1.ANO1.707.1 assembled CDS
MLKASQRTARPKWRCLLSSRSYQHRFTSNSAAEVKSLSDREKQVLHRRVLRGLSAMRNRGHYAASLDPLGSKGDGRYLDVPLLRMDDDLYVTDGSSFKEQKRWSVNEIVKALKGTYASNVGIETSHVENENQKNWLLCAVEKYMSPTGSTWTKVDSVQQMRNLNRLIRTDHAAKFLNKKFPSAKVFGIDGCESLIPGLWAILERGSHKWGMEGVEMGMAHRGRMNVLHDVLGKSFRSICTDFNESEHYYGDVRYHLGTRATVTTQSIKQGVEDKKVHISLAANPSHLEAVNSVVMGKCKAKQRLLHDDTQRRIMPILLHGDASFSGQGVVPECLELSNMSEYNVGGTIHIIINNQIGFTTDPRDARTAYHCTDVAKGVGAPIFHVNGDDVDAVVKVCKIAVDWRMQFKRDCVVDIVCYRRHGHNEQDDPKITHPIMNKKISAHPPTLEIYKNKLIEQGLVSETEIDSIIAMNYEPDPVEWLQSNWQGDALGTLLSKRPFNTTGVRWNVLQRLGRVLTTIPDDIVVHKDVQRYLNKYKKVFESGEGVTWALAEALAFGSLVESMMVEHPVVNVRLSGQDTIRGTFNQRHAAIVCQETGKRYWPLHNLKVAGFEDQATIDICNSNLSEFAVMGFEYGYSLSNEMALTIFEAQFGDFANNAQCIIDNFISSGEQKWNNKSSIVLLLPHGYEGNGPEHSSGRLERFLSMVDDDQDAIPGKSDFNRAEIDAAEQKHNLIVCVPSTPAQYFHCLRRQVHRPYAKPLVLMSAKWMLHHALCVSQLRALSLGTHFQRVIMEGPTYKGDNTTWLLCCGKIFYQLFHLRESHNIRDVTFVRLEQIAPFPYDIISTVINRYPEAELVWCQEEPKNMGAYFYVKPRLATAMADIEKDGGPVERKIQYVGRMPSGAPANGGMKQHLQDQKEILIKAIGIDKK